MSCPPLPYDSSWVASFCLCKEITEKLLLSAYMELACDLRNSHHTSSKASGCFTRAGVNHCEPNQSFHSVCRVLDHSQDPRYCSKISDTSQWGFMNSRDPLVKQQLQNQILILSKAQWRYHILGLTVFCKLSYYFKLLKQFSNWLGALGQVNCVTKETVAASTKYC